MTNHHFLVLQNYKLQKVQKQTVRVRNFSQIYKKLVHLINIYGQNYWDMFILEFRLFRSCDVTL